MILAAPSCGGALNDSLKTAEPAGNADQVFVNTDLDGTWRGLAVPLTPGALPLMQTLGFTSYGEGPDEIRLIRYSFPAPRRSGTIDYLALITSYEVFYNAAGRFELETRFLGFTTSGIFIDERVSKVLYMDPDRQSMVGTEEILVYEAGRLTIAVDSVLAMDRID